MKYVLDMLPETEILKCKLVDAPMDPNSKVMPDQVAWSKRHRRLVRKLNHLTIIQPDITCKLVYVGYSNFYLGCYQDSTIFDECSRQRLYFDCECSRIADFSNAN